MIKKKGLFFSAVLSAFASLPMLAHADGEETSKLIQHLQVNNDGSVWVVVSSPSNVCYPGLIIPANHIAKNSWLSMLISARQAQTPMTIAFTGSGGGCIVNLVDMY